MGLCYCIRGSNDERDSKVNCFSWLRSEVEARRKEARRKAIVFSFEEIATATNNFSDESIIGEGSLGPVYRGTLERTAQVIAAKRMNNPGSQICPFWVFRDEINVLSRVCHPNLVKLIGYCAGEGMRHVVYEFMPLGSLESRLHDINPKSKVLDWNTRMKIAADVAKGLHFLHNENDPPLIYRELKSSRVLLGSGFHAKLSDFGLAKFRPGNDEWQAFNSDLASRSTRWDRAQERKGYIAPEYTYTGNHTTKTDIYSFGILMFELISGTKPADMLHPFYQVHILIDWARSYLRSLHYRLYSLSDPKLEKKISESSLVKAMKLAIKCVADNPNARPDITYVMEAIDHLNDDEVEVEQEEEEEEEEEEMKLLNDEEGILNTVLLNRSHSWVRLSAMKKREDSTVTKLLRRSRSETSLENEREATARRENPPRATTLLHQTSSSSEEYAYV